MSKRIHISLEELPETNNTSENILEVPEFDISDSDLEENRNDINNDIIQAERASDISEGLEDLAMIASNLDEVTPERLALFKTAANMAVAGTDVDATSIIPAIENFKDKILTLEGFVDNIKNVLTNIGKAIMSIIEKIIEFIKGLFSVVTRYTTKLKALKEELKKLNANNKVSKDKEVSIKNAPQTITINGKLPKSFEEYLTNFTHTSKYLEEFPGIQTRFISGHLEIINKAWKISEGKDSEDEGNYKAFCLVNDWFANGDLEAYSKRLSLKETHEDNSGDKAVFVGSTAELLGGQFFQARIPKEHKLSSDSSVKENFTELLESIKTYNYAFVNTKDAPDRSNDNPTVNPVNIPVMEKLIYETESLIKLVNDATSFSKGNLAKINAANKGLLSVLAFFGSDVTQSKKEVNVKAAGPLYKALLHLTKINLSLSTAPNSYILSVIRGVIFMVEKQIASYGDSENSTFTSKSTDLAVA